MPIREQATLHMHYIAYLITIKISPLINSKDLLTADSSA